MTRHWDVRFEVRVPTGARDFFHCVYNTDRLWGPNSIFLDGYRGSFPGVKRPEPGVGHSPPYSSDVKYEYIYIYIYIYIKSKVIPLQA